MALDLFSIREMLRAVEQMYPPKTFLRDLFFKETATSNSEYVDIDRYVGKRRVAPYISPVRQGKLLERLGYTMRSYKPPYVKPKKVTTAGDLLKRQPGETIYAGDKTPMERAQMLLAADLVELDESVTRREEVQCAEALVSGTVTVIDSDTSESSTIDFGQAATHKLKYSDNTSWAFLQSGYPWTDQTAGHSDPMADLRALSRILEKDSGIKPDVIVMGWKALDAFRANPLIREILNWRREDYQDEVDSGILTGGANYWGFIQDLNCKVYSYNEWYLDPTLNDTSASSLLPMIPEVGIIMGSTKARCIRHYGAIQDLDALYSVPRFPKSWVNEDPSVRYVLMQSALLMGLHQPDANLYAEVRA